MTHFSHLAVFVAGTAVIVAVPGPNILYLIARSIHQGRAAGVASVLGIEAATVVHICAATLGLTSVLLSSALAFSAIKYLGAAYLLYTSESARYSRARNRALRTWSPNQS